MSNKEYRKSVYIGTVNGKQMTKTVRASSQKELNAKVTALKKELMDGKNTQDQGIFGVWAEKWMNDIVIGKVCKGTELEYRSAIKHLNSRFEFVSMKKIKLDEFSKLIDDLAERNPNTNKPMSKKGLTDVKKVGANIFRYAIANDIPGITDFFKFVKLPKDAPQKKRRALTVEEQQMIIDTPHQAQVPAMIMLFSGLRRGECLALRWNDIDFDNKLIIVSKSVEFDRNKPVIKSGGKTSNADRIVPIPDILVDFLREYRKETGLLSIYICTNAHGELHTKTSWKKMWDSYLLDLNIKYAYNGKVSKFQNKPLPMLIEPFTAHYLRHTYATMLYLQGIDLQTAKSYLGHGQISVTSDIYTHCDQTIHKNLLPKDYIEKLDTIYSVKTA